MVKSLNKNPEKKTSFKISKSKMRKSINLNKDIFFEAEDICNIDLEMPTSPKIP